MNGLDITIEGIGFWAHGWPDWPSARAALSGLDEPVANAPLRPAASVLAPAERRRAPDPVLLACEIAAQACVASGRDPATLPSIFASTHGDLVITDYMCSTLASAPRELSPIKFHNSVHNAPAGYWTIAAHCHAASTSISAWHSTFGAALFEAAVEAVAEDRPVLLAAYDTESRGPLLDVSPSGAPFGVAMVVSADRGTGLRLRLGMEAGAVDPTSCVLPAGFAALAANNPMAETALPFLHGIARGSVSSMRLAAGARSVTTIQVLA